MMTMKNYIIFMFSVVILGGCTIQETKDITPTEDRMDIIRCSGGSKVDVSKMTDEQYTLYTECIRELVRRRNR